MAVTERTPKEDIIAAISANASHLEQMAKDIWEHPEIALEESYASTRQKEVLTEAGFEIRSNIADMPTAFIASWGTGSPVIGILGEYDALPGLSQKVSSQREPIEEGGHGHGCGHNVFGTAGVGAVLATKEILEAQKLPGTIRYYGCPAEETLVGKTFMARAGVFDDLDAAITWHPGATNMVVMSSSAAMNSFKVNFYGTAAHAGGSPHLGRSALDGLQLMDVGVNYLREHVIPEARLHSVITHGGQAPNVVPAFAQAWWYVRAPTRQQVDSIYKRVLDIAKGAALMTGTNHEIDFMTACYDYLPNKVLAELMYENLQMLDGSMAFDESEFSFADELQATFPEGSLDNQMHFLASAAELNQEDVSRSLSRNVLRHSAHPPGMGGSTEVGDVSHITPTVQITSTCWPLGTPGHSWQTVASSGSSIAIKGMLFAAKAMALTAYDLMSKPDALTEAKKEFDSIKGESPYTSPLPDGVSPK